MICDKCNGKGYYTNPRYFQMSNSEAYERGYATELKCSKCGGSGLLLGNANEIIDRLNVAIKTKTPLSVRELKQLMLVLKR
jgi:hypothetical protein